MRNDPFFADFRPRITDDVSIELYLGEDNPMQINPDNTHHRLLGAENEQERAALIAEYVENTKSSVAYALAEDEADPDNSKILPLIRPQLDADDMFYFNVLDDQRVYLAEELEHGWLFINEPILEKMESSKESLYETAVANLEKRVSRCIEMYSITERVHMVVTGDNLEASLVLNKPFWNHIAKEFTGPPLAGFVAVDLVFLADGDDPLAREELEKTINDADVSSGEVSPQIWKRENDAWVPDRYLN